MLDVAYYIYPNLGDICSANAQKQKKKKRICSSSWGFCQQLFCFYSSAILLRCAVLGGIVFFSCVCGLDRRWRINKITDPFSPLERICWSSYNNNQRDFWGCIETSERMSPVTYPSAAGLGISNITWLYSSVCDRSSPGFFIFYFFFAGRRDVLSHSMQTIMKKNVRNCVCDVATPSVALCV